MAEFFSSDGQVGENGPGCLAAVSLVLPRKEAAPSLSLVSSDRVSRVPEW